MIIDGIGINGVTCDSRKVKKGDAFVAVRGEKSDGNLFIKEAVKNGASIIFTDSHNIDEDALDKKNIKVKKVSNTRKKLAQLCNEFYNFPSEKLKVIGVTGTNGKTTTSHLIYKILKDAGVSVGLIGTLYVKINDKTYKTNLTTPDQEQIFHYLSLMEKEDVQVVVMEVSSHALESYRVFGIDFDIAIHTNIGRDHLDFHKTMENYIASKKKLFDSLSTGKIALINLDDEHGLKLLDKNNDIIVLTYGLNQRSTITASSLDIDFNVSFTYCLQRGLTTLTGAELEPFEFPISLNLLGRHNMYNALPAITTCLLLDIPISKISKSLKEIQSVPRRMEIVYQKDICIIDDFCHNPLSYEAVFQTIQNMSFCNLHIVNAIRGNRGKKVNDEIASVIQNWAKILNVKNVFLTSSRDCVSGNDYVTEEERDAFFSTLKNGQIIFQYEDRLFDAIKKTISYMKKGDMLLLLGAQGMNMGAKLALMLVEDYINKTNFDLNNHENLMRGNSNYLRELHH
ncbi:UDP-N-acetylmuramoyl-L-alanyl-D-glutamate--2,6-diaminopimelate ligase [Serpentinicella sp. ANB-PHB4]|uniref:Mur ligase family protein n=1 Tax=Serpentinicella sp. ANB-PHB4 TaxID=3074076 RepID=UPI0028634B4D|nr:UDP-N-acetylmuramoyl-L-alanyl-D-glutamate--2,6-diaminopimelate ligase [Serpentinicella sp. ANB-PHB4]MDR5659382.1 UDP-N-acetylmuramoyl-L-alanyl-D-glutamate--2,6-diaminopimelate ligase [Serpentinicella sp. ANB-PHB4]